MGLSRRDVGLDLVLVGVGDRYLSMPPPTRPPTSGAGEQQAGREIRSRRPPGRPRCRHPAPLMPGGQGVLDVDLAVGPTAGEVPSPRSSRRRGQRPLQSAPVLLGRGGVTVSRRYRIPRGRPGCSIRWLLCGDGRKGACSPQARNGGSRRPPPQWLPDGHPACLRMEKEGNESGVTRSAIPPPLRCPRAAPGARVGACRRHPS